MSKEKEILNAVELEKREVEAKELEKVVGGFVKGPRIPGGGERAPKDPIPVIIPR